MKSVLYLSILCFVLLISSCAIKQPREKGSFIDSDLVELIKLDPSFKLDIRYASNNNFVGKPVYSEASAFLQRPAAIQLVAVN